MRIKTPEFNFSELVINLKKHDTGYAEGCLPAYIEVELGKTPKDKGNLVLDLGNYIYRELGLTYEMCPEYRGKGKKTTIRWFMSWKHFEPIRLNVLKAFGKEKLLRFDRYIPFEFNFLIIQNPKRGVVAKTKVV